MFKLKTDPKLKHHYMIGVGMHGLRAGKNAGKLYIKYGPLHFTNDDVKKVQSAVILSQDKLFPTSEKEAMKMHDCSSLVAEIGAMKISARVNECTMHHFSSEFEIEDDWFRVLVKAANISDFDRDLLERSKISV